MACRHFSVKSGRASTGEKHADYIAGLGNYAERDDVRYVADKNLPGWAKDGSDFFAAADKFERANGRAYTEIEAAIPRSVADPVAYAIDYAEKTIGINHPYRLAVHDKLASDGGRNVHMHLMFSDRKLDGFARPREQFFKRASSAYRHPKTKQMMPADPAKGGAIKDRTWNERATVQALREGYSAHAMAHGVELDLRSNELQGLGKPEPKIGPAHPRAAHNPAQEQRQADAYRLRQVRHEIPLVESELAQVHAAFNHQERRNVRDTHRYTEPSTLAEMRDVWGIDNVHDLRGPENVLQQNAPRDLRQSQTPSHPDVHKLAADRAARAELAKREAWRNRLAKRRQDWARAGIKIEASRGKGHTQVYRWAAGKAKGFAAVIDYGDRLKPAGNPDKVSNAKIAAMVQIAQQKGWSSVTITGDAEFKKRALGALLAQGVRVDNPELRKYVNAWQQAADIEASKRFAADTLAKAATEEQRRAAAARKQQAQVDQSKERAVQAPAVAPSEPVISAATPLPGPQEQKARAEISPQLATPKQIPPAVDIKVLLAGQRRLQAKVEELAGEMDNLRPARFDRAKAMVTADQQAREDINARAAERGLPKAMPANQWESEWADGWGGQRERAERELAEHRKTKPSFLERGQWSRKAAELKVQVEEWDKRIAGRDRLLQDETAEKLKTMEAAHRARETEKLALLRDAEKKLVIHRNRLAEVVQVLKAREPEVRAFVEHEQQQVRPGRSKTIERKL